MNQKWRHLSSAGHTPQMPAGTRVGPGQRQGPGAAAGPQMDGYSATPGTLAGRWGQMQSKQGMDWSPCGMPVVQV